MESTKRFELPIAWKKIVMDNHLVSHIGFTLDTTFGIFVVLGAFAVWGEFSELLLHKGLLQFR
jgi:hypothetical protein